MSVGALIRIAREAEGLSQAELAERLQLHPSMVSKIEAGKVFIEPETYRRLLTSLRALAPVALLNAMGYPVTVPAAARLPKQLVDRLLLMTPEQHAALLTILEALP